MKSLHLRADQHTIEKILGAINQISFKGEVIEIVDNFTFDLEQNDQWQRPMGSDSIFQLTNESERSL